MKAPAGVDLPGRRRRRRFSADGAGRHRSDSHYQHHHRRHHHCAHTINYAHRYLQRRFRSQPVNICVKALLRVFPYPPQMYQSATQAAQPLAVSNHW